MNFSHLQIATAYSLLSSTISIPALVKKAKEFEYKALAITDVNVLYGVLPFYKACVKAEIKPIIGMTATIKREEAAQKHFLILLAKNQIGYKNLLKISSEIKTNREEAILWDQLTFYRDGLIALTSGMNGEIEQLLLNGKKQEALRVLRSYQEGFSDFYLTIQRNGRRTNESLVKEIRDLAKQTGIPIVATNDVQYLEPSDFFAQQCLTAIRDGKKLADFEDLPVQSNEQYFKNQEEMYELFSDLPEALANTEKIVNECNVMIETHQQLMPKYPLPDRENAADVLRQLCMGGMKTRISNIDRVYLDRMNYELDIIERMGFIDYFLIVWDFMKYARDHGILTGPGRGSAAGSLVAYLLGITDVNPLEHGLLFERFLNPERVTMPDIDIDFPDHRRDEVIHYVMDKYGKEKVAQIITFGTFAAKAAMRDVARVFGFNTRELEQLSKLIPSGLGITLQQAYKESKGLREFVQASEENQRLFSTALTIEGLPRHTSTHAAGIVISEQPLSAIIPIQGGETGAYLTQFPMEDLEEIGLLKMDFLGLRNLSLLERVVKMIEIRTRKKIDLKSIPYTDSKTFRLLQRGDTTGIFQLESEGMRNVLRELKPTEFEDIVAVNALFRPGPMENIPLYIARKHGNKPIVFPHPDLKSILDVTYGVIVYQEQIMQIAKIMAGFSLGEADLLRRAVSKKKKSVLDEERKNFVQGSLRKGYSEKIANEIYDLIVRFANYGFNRSHAVAYSVISWQLAYLKANYPHEFMAALLTSVIGNEEKISKYISEAKQKRIAILPPSVNHSHYPFIAEKNGIRFSLGAIKGIGGTTLKEIIQVRKKGYFTDLFDFCLRVSPKIVNRKVLESLVHAGAFDEFGYDRAVLLASLDVAIEHAELMRPLGTDSDLFADEEMFQLKPKYNQVEPISMAEKLFFEKQALGLYISDHPVSIYGQRFQAAGVVPIFHLQVGQRNISVGVYLTSVKKIRTKKGDLMAFIHMSDDSGEIEGVIFPEPFRKFGSLCQEGETVLITGHIEQRGDQPQLIIQRIVQAEDLPEKKSETLYIKIPADRDNHETLHQLQNLLQENHGSTPVVLHYERTKRTIKLLKNDWVHPAADWLTELQNWLGEKNVVLK